MNEMLPPNIPFLPDQLIRHETGALVSGMDGEFLWVDKQMNPVSPESRPHPMRLCHGVIVDGHLIGTWLDRELMLACMGSIPVNVAEDGHQRADLRASIGTRVTHHPAGTTWAHALDAEPMAMVSDGTIVVFELYHRGLYGIGLKADEQWRMPTPEWSYPKRRPRNKETISLHVHNSECWITSRGGRVQRRSLADGKLIEEHLLEHAESPLEHHFKHGDHDLLCSTTGEVTWLHAMNVVKQVQLGGPVQSGVWDEQFNGWRIAGWREEIVLSNNHHERRETRELPVHIVPLGCGALVLYNDGSWENSPFEFGRQSEE
tara:strand:- start:1933 stop:2883 length:951 start_codon:yes stop_codon:yes gene_type:complete